MTASAMAWLPATDDCRPPQGRAAIGAKWATKVLVTGGRGGVEGRASPAARGCRLDQMINDSCLGRKSPERGMSPGRDSRGSALALEGRDAGLRALPQRLVV